MAPCTLPRRSADRKRTSPERRGATGPLARRPRPTPRASAAEHHDDRPGAIASSAAGATSSSTAAAPSSSPGTERARARIAYADKPCVRRSESRRAARPAPRPRGGRAGAAPAAPLRDRGRATRSRPRGHSRRSRPAAGRARPRAGSPSPIWASTLSVPMTPFMSLANAYASSLVPRAPPSIAIDAGPCCSSASRSIAVAASSASGHDTSTVVPVDLLDRLDEAALGVHPLDAVATLVAQPTVVDRLGVDTEQSHEPVRRRLQRTAALHRARVARRLDRVEVPGPRLEAIWLRGQRADRADLHRVAGEVGVEGLLGEVEHLHAVAALDEVDQGVAGDLVGEARAAPALDATLAVEQHEIADRDRLLEVPLLLDEPRLAGTERERLVLQRALAAAVADRAVERVVHEQELEHAVLDLLHRVALRVARPCLRHGRGARGREAAHAFDLDEAHAAHADRLHALVPAEPRDVDAVLLRGLDQQLAASAPRMVIPSTVTVTVSGARLRAWAR